MDEKHDEKHKKHEFECNPQSDYISADDDSDSYDQKHIDRKKNTFSHENLLPSKKIRKNIKKMIKVYDFMKNN